MKFRYRYVNFGTNFQPAAGDRAESNGAPERLHENEIALDVGSAAWAGDGESCAVVDNHFYPHPYPSAAAGVLHLAEKIHRRFVDRLDKSDVLWLVSHRQPDFDAFCSMYLARGDSRQYRAGWMVGTWHRGGRLERKPRRDRLVSPRGGTLAQLAALAGVVGGVCIVRG